MNKTLATFAAALILMVLGWYVPNLTTEKNSGDTAQQSQNAAFDYFVLSLSWSPTYCQGDAGRNDQQQCGRGRNFAFVVHGLWPQFNEGWPQDCATNEAWVEQSQIDDMMDIMPSKKLIIHEWKKHGTCSGVSQADYFKVTRTLFQKIKIPARYLSPTNDIVTTPEQLVQDFVKTNIDLKANMLSVQCGNSPDRARLSDLRICLSTTGKFQACGANENRSCKAQTLILPRVRAQ